MLPKQNRLTARGDFKGVFSGAELRGRSGPFQLVCRKNGLSHSKFGFVVSLAVSKKAVLRNKLRRRLHDIIYRYGSSLKPGYDCVLRAHPGATELAFEEIQICARELFTKTGMLQKKPNADSNSH